jgi:hypothetical protein
MACKEIKEETFCFGLEDLEVVSWSLEYLSRLEKKYTALSGLQKKIFFPKFPSLSFSSFFVFIK